MTLWLVIGNVILNLIGDDFQRIFHRSTMLIMWTNGWLSFTHLPSSCIVCEPFIGCWECIGKWFDAIRHDCTGIFSQIKSGNGMNKRGSEKGSPPPKGWSATHEVNTKPDTHVQNHRTWNPMRGARPRTLVKFCEKTGHTATVHAIRWETQKHSPNGRTKSRAKVK